MEQGRYFDGDYAIAEFSKNIETTLEAVANRYIAANPRYGYTARPFINEGIRRNENYRYEADFAAIFPDAPLGSYVYAWGRYRAEHDFGLQFTVIPKGPVKIYVNSEAVYGTGIKDERWEDQPLTVSLPVQKGWNDLVLRFTRTPAGFGAEFGTWMGKAAYFFFRGRRLPDLPDIEGFDYTIPLSSALECPCPESVAPHCVPLPAWTAGQMAAGCFGRIFGAAKGYAAARTSLYSPVAQSCLFSGSAAGSASLYAGTELIRSNLNGPFSFEYSVKAGFTPLLIISQFPAGGCRDMQLAIEPYGNGNAAGFRQVNPFFGEAPFAQPWVYAGPFQNTQPETLLPFEPDQLVGAEGERTFWRLDMPSAWVRLYNENASFSHWNYPLGVTLYGLIAAARFLQSSSGGLSHTGAYYASYAQAHVAKAVNSLEYTLFDKAVFGGATAVLNLLASIDSLDDCGSFGSLVLEASKDLDIGDIHPVVEYTANHILNNQHRLPEGCFYRHRLMHHFHNDTLWVDDQYMSVPFLCRYAQYADDPSVLDVAAQQFAGFKKYLYIEEKKLMAHVYDVLRGMNNGIPWGRGNGWTIFSLSELLMALPDDHPRQPFLLDFFRELAQGYLACQGESGLWHQVLDMPSSYPETSCTAMFICAFSRGIRLGWLDDSNNAYRIAAEKAWKAIERHSIDKFGNVYGVCRGSEFSFNPRYYAEHLLPNLNDNHGVGIVLLAGVELSFLKKISAQYMLNDAVKPARRSAVLEKV